MQWYLKVLRQYADFSGRARRKEYWMFTLISVLISIVLLVVDSLLGTGNFTGNGSGFSFSLGIIGGIYSLAVLVPSFAVGARRLHDTGRSGWWQLLILIPLIGAIVLIVFYALEGNRGQNAHGQDPKQGAAQPAY